MFGEHRLTTYRNTQGSIALYSGESKFYGIVDAGSIQISGDIWGIEVDFRSTRSHLSPRVQI